MNSEKQQIMKPVELGFIRDPRRPVLALCADVRHARCAAEHAHPRGQVIYASAGVMRVVTCDSTWLVPPSQAVWVPPMVPHQVYFPGRVSVRNLFIDPSVGCLPKTCTVFNVTPLLRELVLRMAELAQDSEPDAAGKRLMGVALDELRKASPAPMNVPMSGECRLRKVMDALLTTPDDTRTVDEWAKVAGAAPRTLSRLFVSETGMTFGQWRTRLRMLEAVERLSKGHSVTRVAYDMGYQSLSAFIAAFKRAMRSTPGRYPASARRLGRNGKGQRGRANERSGQA